MLKTDKRAVAPLDGSDKGSISLRFGILVCLCVQNASHALLARYSQSILEESYSSAEVVLVSELIKVVITAIFTLTDKTNADSGPHSFSRLLALLLNAQTVIVLVILYAVANLLSYYALARVDAAVYTVLLQLKILTTAAFSVLILKGSFSSTKWRALFLLVLGCVLVASPTFNTSNRPVLEKGNNSGTDDESISIFEAALGVGSILVMVTISGYSAIYFESMLKKRTTSVWEYNFQLAFYSSLLLISIIISERGYNTQSYGFGDLFKGWTISAFILALIQAAGGLLVAASLKYADSILKTLATSGSIVLSAIVGYAVLDAPLDIFVVIGCLATILAISNYTWDATPVPPPAVTTAAANAVSNNISNSSNSNSSKT